MGIDGMLFPGSSTFIMTCNILEKTKFATCFSAYSFLMKFMWSIIYLGHEQSTVADIQWPGATSSAIAFAVWPMLLSFCWSMDGLGVLQAPAIEEVTFSAFSSLFMWHVKFDLILLLR